jgi:hypothetical protein
MIKVPDIAGTLQPAEHLLIITPPEGSGRYGLFVPFGDATLVEAGLHGISAAELPERPFDSVVIESPAADISWADRILGELDQAISGKVAVVVAFVPEYASLISADHSPPALRTLHDFRVVRVGLLGGAVSLVLSRRVGASLPAEVDAAQVASTTSLALELESLARGRQPQAATRQRADRTQAATIFELRDEVHRLSAALASTQQELKVTTRQYRALRYSRLGRITVRYWRLRRWLAGRLRPAK